MIKVTEMSWCYIQLIFLQKGENVLGLAGGNP